MARDEPAIGIDLGTTYSCVGVYRNGRVEIIPNAQGERTTPSVVSFTNATDCLVGEPATNHFLRNPNNTIFDVKRLIGRKFSDPIVQNDMKLWPFTVVAGSGDKPMIAVQHDNEEKQFSAEDISSIVLGNLRETAESYIGSKIENAVVTVPAYFNNAQRQATKEAGSKAGLHVMRVINEPTAAALAYALDQRVSGREGKKNILIFDLGGGTFDVSLLSVDAGDLKAIAIAGDSHLGGEDFDSRLVNYCLDEFEKRHKKDVRSNRRALRRLRTACERAKRILSFQVDTTIDIDSFFDGIDFQMAISVARFDELNLDLFQRCMDLVDQCLKYASISTSLVEEVVLVGGSTRILKIQELLQEFFPNSNMCRRINPDEAVACGAAAYAAMLGGESSMRINDIVVQDVTPLSLGLGIAGGLMSILIPKNSPIPVKKEKCFTTSFDNQSVIKFTVYEGEKTLAMDNNILGDFELSGLPPGPKLSPKIPVTFEINVDGILVVSAENPITKRKSELTIARESGWLSNETTDGNMLGGVEKRRHEEARKRDESKTRLENYASDLNSMLISMEMQKKFKGDQRRALLDEIGKARSWLRMNQSASSTAIESRMMELEKTWSRAFSESAAGSRKWRSFIFWKK